MMKYVVGVQFNPWDQVYHFDPQEIKLIVGDKVIAKTDSALELGNVINVSKIDEETLEISLKNIVRKASKDDEKKIEVLSKDRSKILSKARRLVDNMKLDMKIVDCFFSYDGGKITIVFTAEGRVDFRDLVKELARNFQKSIRLQQIGIRDEAKKLGGIGGCGRELCCKKFLGNPKTVSTDSARIQNIHSRGSDRISGSCGRLMCCLSYEVEFYEKESKKYPKAGTKVKTRQGEGKVLSFNVIKGTINVLIDKNITEVTLEDYKKL
ncbi:MAG: PSP1 domain-containing protein [Candidatus Kerfeldbacteria bacterium]|jgi:cell fate regulator YaaT (PSP1 superfamily)